MDLKIVSIFTSSNSSPLIMTVTVFSFTTTHRPMEPVGSQNEDTENNDEVNESHRRKAKRDQELPSLSAATILQESALKNPNLTNSNASNWQDSQISKESV
ncbi:hypothetical protein OSB04_024897 [Centaurea solstitialis]|uniref:Uncharacterized protein n=1 Tax=Centaurea solstitialis TaxID=347529 RepID=A0AA38SM06_9ASTR|nr:hypothetical protein OSB04_024897 [Centaurea solstitialis]